MSVIRIAEAPRNLAFLLKLGPLLSAAEQVV